jgi:hypothetical protein
MERGYSVIVAETPELAGEGLLKVLAKRGIKNPVIVEVTSEDDEQLELPFPEPKSSIN